MGVIRRFAICIVCYPALRVELSSRVRCTVIISLIGGLRPSGRASREPVRLQSYETLVTPQCRIPCCIASSNTTASASTMVVDFQNNSGLRSISGVDEVLR